MSKGHVKEYNLNQGYGSIIDSASGETLMVYANDVHLLAGQTMLQGQEVEYQLEHHRNEVWAIDVHVVV